jgi:hypothetical protein
LTTKIIIFSGQSNEVGRGLGDFTEPGSENDGRIFQVGRWNNANMTIIPLNDRKLQFWNRPNHGSSRSVLRYYARPEYGLLNESDTIVGVPVAKAGTSILQWLQLVGGWTAPMGRSSSACQSRTNNAKP